MRVRVLAGVWFLGAAAAWAGTKPPPCKVGVVEGELQAGQGYTHALGKGLRVWFQPIASGWILRVVPADGPLGDHDYAELATPPYQSVSPLSISTDFSFRAQDAVGWNPRRFQFAASREDFNRLRGVYDRWSRGAGMPRRGWSGSLRRRCRVPCRRS